MNAGLSEAIKELRLSGLGASLDVRLAEAAGNRLAHDQFLELVLRDELAVRSSRQVERRVRAAMFRDVKSLDEFDFAFNPSIKRKTVSDLATCRFVREKQDVLLLGPPGVGKSFLVQAIGHQAIKCGMLVLYRSIFDLARDFLHDEAASEKEQDKTLARYLKPDLLIIDDMGMKQLPRRSGECLLEIIMRRHENRSTMMTSNRPLEDWAKLIGDVPAATAILDRFLQHAVMLTITGRSYRLKGHPRTGQSAPGAEQEGSRQGGSGERFSPPEDTNAFVAGASCEGAQPEGGSRKKAQS
jgi:DNA replication protein DnaC